VNPAIPLGEIIEDKAAAGRSRNQIALVVVLVREKNKISRLLPYKELAASQPGETISLVIFAFFCAKPIFLEFVCLL
jgi:hypothetical protein